MKKLLISLSLILIITSCIKEERISTTTYVDQVINGNRPPEYRGVTDVQINAYVNKLFIDLYDREPLEAELNLGRTTLDTGGLTPVVRSTYIDALLLDVFFANQQVTNFMVELLEGEKRNVIDFYIGYFTREKNTALANNNIFLATLYQIEIDNLNFIWSSIADFKNGSRNVNDLYASLINNYLYDEINMGDQNFVIATFEHLFLRYPTNEELNKSLLMLKGTPTRLLEMDGTSRQDFVNIMTSVRAFYEGLTFKMYRSYLARNPTGIESQNAVNGLMSDNDYRKAIRNILITNEYAGF